MEEFNFYQIEELFSKGEIKNIVRLRRASEYQMHRKDADVSYFLDAITYEKKLQKTKVNRKQKFKGQKKKFDFQDQAIKRRIIHLYDRATRKYKQNLPLWKEYLQFLCISKSTQKLNRVISSAVQMHPTVVDFWLIGAYVELDLKGNLFASRKLMLQGIRNNDMNPMFYVEYFRFETCLLAKIIQRREILKGEGNQDLQFLDQQDEEQKVEPGTFDTSTKILKIILETMQEKFANNFRVFREIWKSVVKNSSLDQPFKDLVRSIYVSKKTELFCQYLEISLQNGKDGMMEKVDLSSSDLPQIKEIFLNFNPQDVVPIIENLCQNFDEKIEMVLMKSK